VKEQNKQNLQKNAIAKIDGEYYMKQARNAPKMPPEEYTDKLDLLGEFSRQAQYQVEADAEPDQDSRIFKTPDIIYRS